MERFDSMRVVRCLIGAGTFAAAMVAMAGTASAQTAVCYVGGEGDPTFCGHVFTDASNDGTWDSGEGVGNVVVAITNASGTNVGNSPTPTVVCGGDPDTCGYYGFVVDSTPGTQYWICLITDTNNNGDLTDENTDCRDLVAHPESKPVTVGTSSPFVDFKLDSGGEEQPPTEQPWGVGTGTPGYWKNHPEAWPGPVSVGGVTYSLNTAVHPNLYDAIKLMGKVSGDKTYSMFAQLISAKLNSMLANNTVCITDTIAKADQWMGAHPVGSGVKASSAAWAEADAWHQLLDDYNNGKLCAPHRD
jgi:hypothetical protein